MVGPLKKCSRYGCNHGTEQSCRTMSHWLEYVRMCVYVHMRVCMHVWHAAAAAALLYLLVCASFNAFSVSSSSSFACYVFVFTLWNENSILNAVWNVRCVVCFFLSVCSLFYHCFLRSLCLFLHSSLVYVLMLLQVQPKATSFFQFVELSICALFFLFSMFFCSMWLGNFVK